MHLVTNTSPYYTGVQLIYNIPVKVSQHVYHSIRADTAGQFDLLGCIIENVNSFPFSEAILN